jgi:membrane-associated phospholipid phosphatase
MTVGRVHARRPWVLPFLVAAFVAMAILAAVDALPWDRAITNAVIDARTPTRDDVARTVSLLGSTRVVLAVSAVLAWLAARRSPRLALAIIIIAIARPLSEFAIKEIVGRDRPVGNRLVRGRGPSFPSGHPYAAAASWGLIPLVVPLYTRSRAIWWTSVVIVWTIVLLVAASRLWLGVHWTTDVVASVILAIIGVAIVERLLGIDTRLYAVRTEAGGAGRARLPTSPNPAPIPPPTRGDPLMPVHAELDAAESGDRLAIRELFDAYAHCADRRDVDGQKALFTVDARFAVFMDGEGTEPTYVLEGREALTPVFEDLNRYEATTHFNGQSTVTIDGAHATGESYTIAHHLYTEGDQRKVMTAALRYLDRFAKLDGAWYFEERNLILDWSETRPSAP